MTSYDQTVATIVEEINRTAKGDRVEFSVYVLEPGESTQRVLDSMRRAARRGVRVDASLDCSAVSSFTRWCEGTATLASELVEMEKQFPGLVKFQPRRDTDARQVRHVPPRGVDVNGGVRRGEHRRQVQAVEGFRDMGGGIRGGGRTVPRSQRSEQLGGFKADESFKVDTQIGNPYFLRRKPRTVASAVSGAKDMLRRGVSLTVGSRHRNASSDVEARRGASASSPTDPTVGTSSRGLSPGSRSSRAGSTCTRRSWT